MIQAINNHPEKGKLFISFAIVFIFIFVAIAAPILSKHEDPTNPSNFKSVGRPSDREPHPPSPGVLLGTIPGQLDIFHTLVWGTRTALIFGLTITIVTSVFGVFLGAISGYYRGKIGNLILRVTETFLGFPPIAGVALINSYYASVILSAGASSYISNPFIRFMSENNIHPVMLALILFSWMPYVKLTHSSFILQMKEEYIQSAIAIGAPPFRVIFNHILPNIYSPIVVLVAKSIGGVVILDAGLTYIGVSGATDWGTLLVISRDWIVGTAGMKYWWVFFPASLTIILFGLGWNLLGDQLTALFNPRTQRAKS